MPVNEEHIEPAPPAPSAAPAPESAPKLAPVEWARRKNHTSEKGAAPGDWMLAGVLYLRHWVEGDMVTEADFDAAWAEMSGQAVR